MPDNNDKERDESREKAVPSGRLARLSRFGALATTVAGSVVKNGTKQLAQGKRPKLSELLLTPKNALRVANQLAQLRGAAMKLGQLLSMDAGDFLPKELAEILAKLRSDAHHMPRAQLLDMLRRELGTDWEGKFSRFDLTPVAAASIGQVHRAVTPDGHAVAVKIQYPGVRESIDSDIDNVASILKFTGLVPDSLDLAPILAEAKRQLHDEANYLREADCMAHFHAALRGRDGLVMPAPHKALCTSRVLVMDYVEGTAIEDLATAPQGVRDAVMTRLFELMFEELFVIKAMQTDPNFANYRYQAAAGRVVLLDFGATRHFQDSWVQCYHDIQSAALAGSRDRLERAARAVSYFDDNTLPHHRELVLDLMTLCCVPLCTDGPFRFGQTDLAERIRDKGLALAEDRKFWHAPPMDSIFLHRKLGGIFLLAARLKANVDVRKSLQTALARTPA